MIYFVDKLEFIFWWGRQIQKTNEQVEYLQLALKHYEDKGEKLKMENKETYFK